jgi:hypothetical protein
MRLEAIQNALFAAYDIQKTLTPKQLASPIAEASFDETVGSNLQDIIEFLAELEKEMFPDAEDAA